MLGQSAPATPTKSTAAGAELGDGAFSQHCRGMVALADQTQCHSAPVAAQPADLKARTGGMTMNS
jgi:hypothetical protein